MRILKSIAVAFSMYSRIPMPKFTWGTEDMKYHLVFFPWIGVVIGLLQWAWWYIGLQFNIDPTPFSVVTIVIPLMVTGGFHLDGYMDTSDALSSWQEQDRRLEILKDSHIGAFAVIKVLILGMILFSAIYLMDDTSFLAWTFSFFMARAISGICVVRYKKAKTTGSLHTEAKTASDNIVVYALALQFAVACLIGSFYFNMTFTMVLLGVFVALLYYIYTASTKFGGITGDLAGWFVCNAEVLSAVFLAIFSVVKNRG